MLYIKVLPNKNIFLLNLHRYEHINIKIKLIIVTYLSFNTELRYASFWLY